MYLLGASGHAKVIIDILELNGVSVDGLFDKNEKIQNLSNYPVKPENKIEHQHDLLISIGNNQLRKKLAQRFYKNNYHNAIHPSTVIASTVQLGKGVVIMGGAIINPDTIIKDHVVVNTASSIDHDCFIDNFVHIAPKATLCGGIEVGEGTLIGAGAVVIPNVKIGKWVTIGAGSVVTSNVPDYATVVGNPARIIKISK